MRTPTLHRTALLGLLGILLPVGAAQAQWVHPAPPPPVAERQLPPPGPGYAWVPGYQRWTGAHYMWVPGRWVYPPRPHAVWVPGTGRRVLMAGNGGPATGAGSTV